MNRKLLEKFRELYEDEKNLQSFRLYYKALCGWIENNKKTIGTEFIHGRLKILLSLNLEDYHFEEINGNGLDLNKEKERLTDYEYNDIEELLSSITDTLWDMVTISSDEKCPNCKYGDLRYLKINQNENKGKIVMECQDCGHGFYLDGNSLSEKIADYLPASKKDID